MHPPYAKAQPGDTRFGHPGSHALENGCRAERQRFAARAGSGGDEECIAVELRRPRAPGIILTHDLAPGRGKQRDGIEIRRSLRTPGAERAEEVSELQHARTAARSIPKVRVAEGSPCGRCVAVTKACS